MDVSIGTGGMTTVPSTATTTAVTAATAAQTEATAKIFFTIETPRSTRVRCKGAWPGKPPSFRVYDCAVQ
jgi:hypothetical protein